jgi:hypothetical protein
VRRDAIGRHISDLIRRRKELGVFTRRLQNRAPVGYLCGIDRLAAPAFSSIVVPGTCRGTDRKWANMRREPARAPILLWGKGSDFPAQADRFRCMEGAIARTRNTATLESFVFPPPTRENPGSRVGQRCSARGLRQRYGGLGGDPGVLCTAMRARPAAFDQVALGHQFLKLRTHIALPLMAIPAPSW